MGSSSDLHAWKSKIDWQKVEQCNEIIQRSRPDHSPSSMLPLQKCKPGIKQTYFKKYNCQEKYNGRPFMFLKQTQINLH